MIYDEDLLVELIACGDVSQTEIAERVGVSRRTVWRIANGQSHPDLQTKIAATVEGYRQAAIRLAARFMTPLLKKQIEVALEGDPSTGLRAGGETSRKCREFLLKTFMIALPQQAVKAVANRDTIALGVSLTELSPDLKDQVIKELDGPAEEREVEEATVSPSPPALSPVEGSPTACRDEAAGEDGPTATPSDKSFDPFAEYVDGPHGTKVNIHALELEREYMAEIEADKDRPPRRRVPRVPRE